MGSINIDNTGSGGGVTLSSDGTDLLLDGSAIGGGGGGDPDLYRDNASGATTPTASGTNAVAIGDGAISSGEDAISLGVSRATGNHSFAAAIAGNASHIGARGNYSIAMGYEADTGSSSQGAVAIGFEASAGANYAVSLGQSSATGSASFASAIGNASSTYGASNTSGIAIGSLAKAHDSGYAIAIGRNNISSGGSGCTVIGGMNNQAVATSSIITGGAYCSITGAAQYARAGGGYSKASVHGQDVFASGQFSSVGDAQGAKYILRADTTDATATVLTTSNGTPASWNQIVAASDTCITFDGTITAMQNGAQAYASWKIEGLLVNDGGTTTLANSATTVIQNSSNWGMALSADNTNNALAITCTGEASHNIRWVANIRTTECTFA